MKKYFFSLILLTVFMSACQNNGTQSNDKNSEFTQVEVKDFETVAGDYVGKTIQLTGTVEHVCMHGGQRMFLVDNESESRVKVVTSDNVAAFNTELIGDQLLVTGVVDEMRIDEAYLLDWEAEIKAGEMQADDKGEGAHLGGNVEKGGEGAEPNEEMQKVNNLREQLKQSGKEYLAFYSLACTQFEVISEGDEEVIEEDTEVIISDTLTE